MGCFRIVTSKDIQQLREVRKNRGGGAGKGQTDGWKPVASDSRYQEKIVHYPKSGRTTRMTDLAEHDKTKSENDYPHFTEFYDANGKKQPHHYYKDGKKIPSKLFDAHYSPPEGGKRPAYHKTAQAVLDDLDAALKSFK